MKNAIPFSLGQIAVYIVLNCKIRALKAKGRYSETAMRQWYASRMRSELAALILRAAHHSDKLGVPSNVRYEFCRAYLWYEFIKMNKRGRPRRGLGQFRPKRPAHRPPKMTAEEERNWLMRTRGAALALLANKWGMTDGEAYADLSKDGWTWLKEISDAKVLIAMGYPEKDIPRLKKRLQRARKRFPNIKVPLIKGGG
jgi:hypothetical protein